MQGAGASATSSNVAKVGSGATTFEKPVDNIGDKSIADYAAYAGAHIHDIALPGGFTGRMFVGQRKDPFVVNLGEVFDLVNLNPLGPVNGEADLLADANVTSIVLDVANVASAVTRGGAPGSRDTTLLEPEMTATSIDAVVDEVLSGRLSAAHPKRHVVLV